MNWTMLKGDLPLALSDSFPISLYLPLCLFSLDPKSWCWCFEKSYHTLDFHISIFKSSRSAFVSLDRIVNFSVKITKAVEIFSDWHFDYTFLWYECVSDDNFEWDWTFILDHHRFNVVYVTWNPPRDFIVISWLYKIFIKDCSGPFFPM